MSYKLEEERIDETDSIEISRGMQGKYSYSIKLYARTGEISEAIDELGPLKEKIEKKLYGEKSPEAPKAKPEVKPDE